jgi:hypothetical protein
MAGTLDGQGENPPAIDDMITPVDDGSFWARGFQHPFARHAVEGGGKRFKFNSWDDAAFVQRSDDMLDPRHLSLNAVPTLEMVRLVYGSQSSHTERTKGRRG